MALAALDTYLLVLRFLKIEKSAMTSSLIPFFGSQKPGFHMESDWIRFFFFFCFVATGDILRWFNFHKISFRSKPMAILMLRMPSMSLPSLPSFRRWHVLLFMALMATTMLQGCGCVDTRLKTNKNKPMQGLP